MNSSNGTVSTGNGAQAPPQSVRHALQGQWVRFKGVLRHLSLAPGAGVWGTANVIRSNLESPVQQLFRTTGTVPVSGWACAETGIAAVEVYLNDVLLRRLDTGLVRPDIRAAFPRIENAGQSGFSGTFDLRAEPLGEHALAVVIRDRAGNQVRIERTVQLLERESLAEDADGGEDEVRYSLDAPGFQTFVTNGTVPVSGWACSSPGIDRLEFYLDGTFLKRLEVGQPRPDVALLFPTIARAGQSGFSGSLQLAGQRLGRHSLTLVIHDRKGRTVSVERRVELVEPHATLPVRQVAASGAIRYSLDSPGEQTVLTTGVVPVSGWACAEAGVEALELHLDDVLVKRLATGQARPDVGAVYPHIPDAGRSGFSESINLLGERFGDHALTLVIRDGAGQIVKVERTVRLVEHEMLYHRYFLASLPTPEAEGEILRQAAAAGDAVAFEIWVEGEGSRTSGLAETISSIVNQGYPHWRLHLPPGTIDRAEWPLDDTRILLTRAAELCQSTVDGAGVFMVFLRAGEILVPGALSRVVRHLAAHPETVLLYGDHDRVKPGGLHTSPSFKPDWSPDHLLSRNYVGDVFFVRQSGESVEVCRELLGSTSPAWRYELMLRLSERPCSVAHLPDVLWSRPLEQEGDLTGEAEAVRASLERRGWQAEVEESGTGGVRRLRWRVPEQPKVSIIIPTTGNPALLAACVESLLEKTAYRNFELVFLDNGRGRYPEGIAYLREKGVRVLERDEPFNWAKLNNDGARAADGELLLFLNDDVEVVEPEWLEELVSQACREEVGCVGALLVYPDDRIQHAGVFLVDHGGGARHFLRGLHRDEPAYEHLHRVVREVSCNTGACLMIRRELFERVGGFDEALAIVGNDIDLCLRLREAGYRNLWTPYARLVHHESYSRKEIDILDDEGRMWQRWGEVLQRGDPCYNVNLTPHHTDCSLNLELLKQREQPNRPTTGRPASGRGLNLIGYIKAEMGIGQAMRGLAAACDAARIPFDIYNYEHHNPARMGDETWASHITREPSHGINLLQVNADLTAAAWNGLPSSVAAGRYTIGYWVWELPEFPDAWTEAFRFVNEVWVPSGFVQQAVTLKSPVPVVRIPYVVEKRRQSYLGRQHFSLPAHAFLFLTMYDVHSIPERKNPRGAIAAFRQAFAADDPRVGLVLKVNNCSDQELCELRELIDDQPNIYIVGQTLSRYEVDSLIHACDAFLSLHRAEGFGLTLAESMALGRPVIATHWSGNTDFTNAVNSACVDYRLVPLDRDHGPYRKGQLWAEPDLEHAAWWMRRLRDDAELRNRIVGRAQQDIGESLSARRVGALVADRLRHIRTQ